MDIQRQLPLKGIRVIELGNYIAAPTAGRLLADFGAEVIKVERPITGDELRNWRLKQGTVSMLYRTINRNKKSIEINLKNEIGRSAIRRLVKSSDVLIENFRPGTLERWGLGPSALEKINSKLIVSRISAYGQTGPMSNRPGFAAVAEAYSGFRNLVGDPDRAPVRVGVSIADSIAGLYAALGVIMSLYQRDSIKNNEGNPSSRQTSHNDETTTNFVIDVALHEAMFSMLESLIPDYDAYGEDRIRTGGRVEGIAPSNAYRCGDGKSVVIAGNGDGIFRRYMAAIGRNDLANDETLQTNAQRWDRRDELDAAIEEWTLQRESEEVLNILDAAEVPAGPIFTAADIVNEPQFQYRNMVQKMDVSNGEKILRDVRFPGIVPVLDKKSLPINHLGPDLGEHNQEILQQDLDFSADEIELITGQR